MSGFLLNRLAVGGALFTLSACAYATPYPAAFPDATGPRIAPADSGRDDRCVEAISDPGDAEKVSFCIRSRGQAWDNRGRAIRQQAGYVGQLSIPLGIAGLGLSAAGDRSDFVPLSAGVTSASLAHTGAYARPAQAEVYELATVAYRCLLAGVAEWNSSGKAVVTAASRTFDDKNRAALRAVRNSVLSPAEKKDLEDQLLAQAASVRRANNVLDGSIGVALLRQSDEIDSAVIRAIRDRLPDPQAVAASIARSGPAPADTPEINPPAAVAREATAAAAAEQTNQALVASGRAPTAPVTQRMSDARRVMILVEETEWAAKEFDAAAKAHAGASRTVSPGCALNPSSLPGLTATPTEVVLDSGGGGSFLLRNGVPPYGNLPPPTGLRVNMTPMNSTSSLVQVTADAGATGPWKIQMMDGSAAGSVVEVAVKRSP